MFSFATFAEYCTIQELLCTLFGFLSFLCRKLVQSFWYLHSLTGWSDGQHMFTTRNNCCEGSNARTSEVRNLINAPRAFSRCYGYQNPFRQSYLDVLVTDRTVIAGIYHLQKWLRVQGSKPAAAENFLQRFWDTKTCSVCTCHSVFRAFIISNLRQSLFAIRCK